MDLNTRGLVNYLLLPVSGIFYFLSTLRKFLYQVGLLTVRHFDVPVIVVGNITVGGSGKTPIVIALVDHFKQQGKKVAWCRVVIKARINKEACWLIKILTPVSRVMSHC